MVGVFDRKPHVGVALGLPVLCPGEDDVLHVVASQGLRALFAQYPADGVRNVALAAAVRTYNAHDTGVKFQDHLVSEGFKSLGFNLF